MRKFVLTADGTIRLGDVNMHRQLLLPGEGCLGGGTYEFDYLNGRLLLDGRSYDYGRPKWQEVEAVGVAEAYRGLDIYWQGEPLDVRVEYRG